MNTSKLTYLFAFLLVAFVGFSAQAQEYAFKVVSKKGTATVAGAELKVGSKIQSAETIVVADGAVLNIAHNNGKSLNISKPGTYKASELEKGCTAQAGSLAGKYADFVLKELTSGDGDAVGAKNMKKPGSVVRGTDAPTFTCMTFEQTTQVAPGSMIMLRWFTTEGVNLDESTIKSYTFVVKDLMGNELSKTETKEPFATIDLSNEIYANVHGGALSYYVYVNEDPSKKSLDHVLKPVSKSNAAKVKQDLEMLSEDNSALGKLILARYFEDQQLYVNAIYAYEEAIKLSEGDELYKSIYEAFLDRNYLSKKSKKELAEGSAKTSN